MEIFGGHSEDALGAWKERASAQTQCKVPAGGNTWVGATAAQALLSDALHAATHVAANTHVPYESYQAQAPELNPPPDQLDVRCRQPERQGNVSTDEEAT